MSCPLTAAVARLSVVSSSDLISLSSLHRFPSNLHETTDFIHCFFLMSRFDSRAEGWEEIHGQLLRNLNTGAIPDWNRLEQMDAILLMFRDLLHRTEDHLKTQESSQNLPQQRILNCAGIAADGLLLFQREWDFLSSLRAEFQRRIITQHTIPHKCEQTVGSESVFLTESLYAVESQPFVSLFRSGKFRGARQRHEKLHEVMEKSCSAAPGSPISEMPGEDASSSHGGGKKRSSRRRKQHSKQQQQQQPHQQQRRKKKTSPRKRK